MRQVNEAELVWNVCFRLRAASATLRRNLAARDGDTRRRAERQLAQEIVRGALGRFEVLSSAPLPPGTDLFSAAAYGKGAGSAPSIDDDAREAADG